MFAKNVRRALACASLIAVAAGSTPASAQQIDRIVAFGDSYADTGNAFALGYANPQALSLYPTRRFSGGSVYIDTLANILQVPVQDFAIGGAFGGSNNGTLCYDPFYAPGTSPLCGKGLQYEIDQFLNVGAQSSVFPAASTTLTEHDLVAISIGANDARFYQQAGGTLAGAPTAGTAAAAAASLQLDRLVAAGSPTISFLAGDSGRLPEVAASPSLAAIRSAYSGAFNTSMQSTLAGYAADGVIVHYLDLNLVGDNIIANPSAYGLTSAGPCPAAQVTQCVADPNFVNQYLFYVDALHLTSQGFNIVAQYIARQLAAPLTLQAPSDLGLDTASQFGRTLSTRSDLYGNTVTPGLKLFAVGDFFSRNVAVSEDNSPFDIDGVGGTIGAEYGVGGGAIGVAANYSRPRVRFGNDSARINAHSWQIGAYGGLTSGGLSGQAYVGYGWDKHKITRTGVVENMNANPSGSHVLAGAKGTYLIDVGPAKIGPLLQVDYARAKVDGYTESGDPALNLNVGGQTAKSLTGQAGLEVRADFTGIHPYLDLTAEHQFASNNRVISFAQTSAPTIVNRWTISGGKDTYGRVAFGAAADLWKGMSLDAAVTTTLGKDGGRATAGHVGLRASF